MQPLRTHVRHGRLVLDELTDLPEGEELLRVDDVLTEVPRGRTPQSTLRGRIDRATQLLAVLRALGPGLLLSLSACSSTGAPTAGGPTPPSDAAAPWLGEYLCTSTLTTRPEAGGPPEILTEDGGLGVVANGDTLSATVYFELEGGVLAEDLVCSNLLAVISSKDMARLVVPDSGSPPSCVFAVLPAQLNPACWTLPGTLEVDYLGGTLTLDGGALTLSLAYQARTPGSWPACDGGVFSGSPDSGIIGSGTQLAVCTRR